MIDLMHYAGCFFGGAFLTNAIPHFVSGTMGRPFQTPFADPPGEGLSSATANVLWGFLNLVIAYVLLRHLETTGPHATNDILVAGMGMLLLALFTARHFGRFHGGNNPRKA
jgi:hypothetical protein